MDDKLVISLITLAGVGFTAVMTWSISQRRIATDHITAERAKWRENIRARALLVHDAILCGNEVALSRLESEFRALLNPLDPEDQEILNRIKVVEQSQRQEGTKEFARRISLLLKHDWDRAKLEAGFFLARWTLAVRRREADRASGMRERHQKRPPLRWYEKYRIRPVRTLFLVVFLMLGFWALAVVSSMIGG